MGDVNQSGVKAVVEFQEDSRAPLIELNNSDSTELWLIQWPKDQIPDFNGQEISLDLHQNGGPLGSFESSSGKSYDVVSLAAQEPASVFLSSPTDSKIVGKITRRVSFVNYLDPSEVPKDDTKKLKQFYEKSVETSLTNSAYNKFATPTKSTRSGHPSGRASTHSSGRKSSLSEDKHRTKDSKPSKSTDSGHGSERSEEKKAKKRKKQAA